MNLKSQKGITSMDVTVAIMIIVIFSSIIVSLYQNYSISSKRIEREAEATEYAIETVEEIKANSSKYFDDENSNKDTIPVYNNEVIGNTGFTRTANLVDYASLEGNKDKKLGYVKNVSVVVNYKIGNKDEKVELNTVISKEN